MLLLVAPLGKRSSLSRTPRCSLSSYFNLWVSWKKLSSSLDASSPPDSFFFAELPLCFASLETMLSHSCVVCFFMPLLSFVFFVLPSLTLLRPDLNFLRVLMSSSFFLNTRLRRKAASFYSRAFSSACLHAWMVSSSHSYLSRCMDIHMPQTSRASEYLHVCITTATPNSFNDWITRNPFLQN